MLTSGHYDAHLWTAAPGLVWRDDDIGCDEESPIFRGRNHVVRLIPHALHPIGQHPAAILKYVDRFKKKN